MTKIKDLPKTCPERNRRVERPREKLIAKSLVKTCVCCGKKIKVFVYKNNTCRGGHYFGKIPLCSKRETNKAIKAGFKLWHFENSTFRVLKKDPKPYAYAEYWECPKCYR